MTSVNITIFKNLFYGYLIFFASFDTITSIQACAVEKIKKFSSLFKSSRDRVRLQKTTLANNL